MHGKRGGRGEAGVRKSGNEEEEGRRGGGGRQWRRGAAAAAGRCWRDHYHYHYHSLPLTTTTTTTTTTEYTTTTMPTCVHTHRETEGQDRGTAQEDAPGSFRPHSACCMHATAYIHTSRQTTPDPAMPTTFESPPRVRVLIAPCHRTYCMQRDVGR